MTRRLGLLVTDASLSRRAMHSNAWLIQSSSDYSRMVCFEVTQDLAKTGALDVVAWTRRHHG